MFELYDTASEGRQAAICLAPDEEKCVALAVADLCSDLHKVSGLTFSTVESLDQTGARLIIGTLSNTAIRRLVQEHSVDVAPVQGKWERYLMQTLDDATMVILGSDERGAMWGIYDFCARFLEVDPLYWWTGNHPSFHSSIAIADMRIHDGPKGYPFRGWFINDEDLLSGLCVVDGQPASPMQKGYGPVLARIIETALRLKQNLLIPCSFLNIHRPEDEAIVRQVTERGLFISMHHQEPVGVSQQTIDLYCQAHGVAATNYVDYPEIYEAIWQDSIRKWARWGDRVIWQLGLRGRGDRPVWYGCDRIPDTDAERGMLISKAIATQLSMIHAACGEKPVYSTTTLWMEGMPLYEAGALNIPQETTIVMSDFGPDQTWPNSYEALPRLKDHSYGVYNHLAFWGCGPHLIQGNSAEKISLNFHRAIKMGDVAYSVTNVANVREFVCGIAYMAQLTWNPAGKKPGEFMQQWCAKEFVPELAEKIADLYAQYFHAFASMDDTGYPRRMVFMDGMCRRVALQLMDMIQGGELTQPDIQNKRLFNFPDTDQFIAWYRHAAQAGEARFGQVYRQAQQLRDALPEARRTFFDDQLTRQSGLMQQLYAWVHALCQAAEKRRQGDCGEAFHGCMDRAMEAMRTAIRIRQGAAYGVWSAWYNLDQLSNFAELLRKTEALREL